MYSTTVLLAILSLFPLLTSGDDEVYPEDIDYNFCKCNCADLTVFDIPDPPFKTTSNCVRIMANGAPDNPGGYLFILDSFGNDHTVFHDLWFRKNKRKQRWLSGGFWRIYYPWINASHTSDDVPFVVQNLLTREYLTASTVYELQVFHWVLAAVKLTQSSLWKTVKQIGGDGLTRWKFQNAKTNEWLLQHPSATGESWWQGRIFAHNTMLWDKFREGGLFWTHPCY